MSYVFKTSSRPTNVCWGLDSNEVPSISAKRCLDEKRYPMINEDIFNAYCSFKYPENNRQQEKALRMLQSRKLVAVKTLRDNFGI